MRYQWLIILTALIIFVGVPHIVTAAVPFSDISNHWAKDEINALAQKEIVKGMEEGRYRPELPLTKGQFITMLHRVLKVGNEYNEQPPIEDYYSDVTQAVYYADELYNLTELGIVDDKDTFKGETKISRQMVAHYLRKAYEFKTGIKGKALSEENKLPFTDYNKIDPGFVEDVYYTNKWGLFKGYTDGSFAPLHSLTRAQGAVVIYRLQQLTTEPENKVDFKEVDIKTGPNLELIYDFKKVTEGIELTFSYELPSPAYFGKIEKVTLDTEGVVTIVINKSKLDDDNSYPAVITIEQRTLRLYVSNASSIKIVDSKGELIKKLTLSS